MALEILGLEAASEYSDIALLILRLALGGLMLMHGFPKWKNMQGLKGWFQSIKLPAWLVPIVATFETLGGLGLLLGAFTQIAAILVIINMLGTTWVSMTRLEKPLLSIDKPGYELDLYYVAVAIALFILGPGAYSVDAFLAG